MAQALEGLKVLDLTRHAPGPFCTMILGDLGADVTKVEGLEPVAVRSEGPMKGGGALPLTSEFASPESPYNPVNRNKRSIRLNLKETAGQHIFHQLAEKADVIVEGFRPGAVERLGIDYQTIRRINKGVIYCAITGYGQDGPFRNLPGHDLNYVSHGGLMSIMSYIGVPPPVPGNIAGDMVGGGMQAVIGILAALMARVKTGEGQYVDISMTDGVVSLLSLYIGGYFQQGEMPKKEDLTSCGVKPYYGVYETSDGKFISIACAEPKFYMNLCQALGCEEFIPYQTDIEKEGEIKAYFKQQFLTKTRDEWFDILSRGDIAVSKVLTLGELAADPQLSHRGMIAEIDHPVEGTIRQPGISVKLSETPGAIKNTGSAPGEDTRAILAELGYSGEDIEKLQAAGVVGMSD
jgi:crotonobetainyl-CoA:carnitine CoA-transferase CaiB-like acyl-CoA transferase